MVEQIESRPNGTKQDYETPPDLLGAIRSRFGVIAWDLAAVASTCKADNPHCFFGPGSPSGGEDALAQVWDNLEGTIWLNPPYRNIEPWANMARRSLAQVRLDESRLDRHNWRLLMLTPASVGSNWYAMHVHRHARVLALRPRISFVGTDGTDRRDYILSIYGETPGFDVWRWK